MARQGVREIVKGEVIEWEDEFETPKGTFVVRKWKKRFGRKPQNPYEVIQVSGGIENFYTRTKADAMKRIGKTVKKNPRRKASPAQLKARKLFTQRVKSGAFRKRIKRKSPTRKSVRGKAATYKSARPKRKTVKRKTAKRKIASSPLRAPKRARTARFKRGAKSPTTRQRATRFSIRRNPSKRKTSKFVIVGVRPSKTGYTYYYLTDADTFRDTKRGARRFNTRPACHAKMREIAPKLPFAIKEIRCEKV